MVQIVPPYSKKENPLFDQLMEEKQNNEPKKDDSDDQLVTSSDTIGIRFTNNLGNDYLYKSITIEVLSQTYKLGDEKLSSVTVSLGANEKTSTIQVNLVDVDLETADIFYSFSRASGGIKLPKEFGSTPQTNTGTTTTGSIDLENIPNGLTGDELAKVIIQYCKANKVEDDRQIAYVLATTEHESTMGVNLQEIGGESAWYAPYFGRGLVQLTHPENYEKAGIELGLGATFFIDSPDLLTELKYAVPILVIGMRDGWFTGVGLFDFGSGDSFDSVGARAIVNGNDRDTYIADLASAWLSKLSQLGYDTSLVVASPANDGSQSKELIDNVSTVGNEIVLTVTTVSDRQFVFKFILTDTSVTGLPCAEFNFSGKAIRYSLTMTEKTENFEAVTPLEAIEIISSRYGITVDNSVDKKTQLPIDIIEQRKDTDYNTVLDIAKSQNLEIIDNTKDNQILVTSLDEVKSTTRIIPSDLIDVSWSDSGVIDEEPQYPVSLTLFTTEEILELKPRDTITLRSVYSFIPDSLKNDEWVINTISHDFVNETSQIQLQKYIPENNGGSGSGTLSESEILSKYKNAVVKVGNEKGYASGFFVSTDGYIICAAHQSGSTENIETADNKKLISKEIVVDRDHDVMLLKVEGSGFTTIPIAPDVIVNYSVTKIGHGVTTESGIDGTQNKQKDWDATTSKIVSVEENGYRNLKNQVVVADDETIDFVNAGDSGCPWIDQNGLVVSVTSQGDKSKFEGGGKGGSAWGCGVKQIIDILETQKVNYTKGQRQTMNDSGNAGGSTGGGGIYPGWALPSDGVLTSDYGERNSPTSGASRNHKGWDIAAGQGSPIYAASSGRVVDLDWDTNGSGYGNYIVIAHNDPGDVWTLYGHCLELLVSLGQSVSMRQQIALEDSTGVSTGSHLHFEMRRGSTSNNFWSGSPINPREYLPVPPSAYSPIMSFDNSCLVDLSDRRFLTSY